MARIRKIPDTWTLEIHATVLKDSRQAEHEEIGYTKHDKIKLSILENQRWWERSSKRKETLETKDTIRRCSVYSNINAGGRGAQNEKKRSKQKDTIRRSSVYSNINAGGRGA